MNNPPSTLSRARALLGLGIGLTLLLTSVAPTWAGTQTYTDRTMWQNAITALDPMASFTDDLFNTDIARAQSITFDSGVMSTNSPEAVRFADNSVVGGVYTNAVDGSGNGASQFIDWTFPMAILGFGADFSGLATNAQITGNFDGTGDTTFTPTNGFFGIVGMNPFSTIRFSIPGTSNFLFNVDNLVFAEPTAAVPAVPEPGTLLLLGTGLAGLAAWRARQTRKA